jgi:hypothetical protein
VAGVTIKKVDQMINMIPIIGWMVSVAVAISMAIPFWIFWSLGHVGTKFFYFLPAVFTSIGFWDTVMLFVVISILKAMLVPVALNVGGK